MTPRHHLPRAYFADAPTLPAAPLSDGTRNSGGPSASPATENLGRPVTANEAHTSGGARTLTRTANTGAAARETAGESGAGDHSPERAHQLHAARTIFGKKP